MGEPVLLDINGPDKIIELSELGEGDYYWTIQAETIDGLDVSAKIPAHFRVLPIALLSAPKNMQPAEGHAITPAELRDSRAITFAWDRVEGADDYIFTLFEADGDERRMIIQIDSLTGTKYTLNDLRLLKSGHFVWTVEAVNRLEDGSVMQSGQKSENQMVINIPELKKNTQDDTGTLYGQ
jgi:hypothetical protein